MYECSYYQRLRVSENATFEEIKKAYRKIAKSVHPDVNKSSNANKLFQELNEAFEVLNNPVERSEYDKKLRMYNNSKKAQRSTTATAEKRYDNSYSGEAVRKKSDGNILKSILLSPIKLVLCLFSTLASFVFCLGLFLVGNSVTRFLRKIDLVASTVLFIYSIYFTFTNGFYTIFDFKYPALLLLAVFLTSPAGITLIVLEILLKMYDLNLKLIDFRKSI